MAEKQETTDDSLYKSLSRLVLRISLQAAKATPEETNIYNLALNILNHAQGLIGKDNARVSRLLSQALRIFTTAKQRKSK